MFKRSIFLSCLLTAIALGLSGEHYPLGGYHLIGDKAYPVMAAKGEAPVALVSNRRVTVKSSEVVFSKVPIYAGGFIRVHDEKVDMDDSKPTKSFALGYGGDIPSPTSINVRFTPTTDYRNLYALVISGSKQAMALKDPDGLFMTYTDIGWVRSGKRKQVSLKAYYMGDSAAGAMEMETAILFFDQGSPILTNIEDRAYKHFRQRRQQAHEEKLEKYLRENRGESVKQKAYKTFTPYLPKKLYNELGSVKTKVVLNISRRGAVSVESFSNLDHPRAESFLRKAISDWYFYPKLEDGIPVDSRTATMIEF